MLEVESESIRLMLFAERPEFDCSNTLVAINTSAPMCYSFFKLRSQKICLMETVENLSQYVESYCVL